MTESVEPNVNNEVQTLTDEQKDGVRTQVNAGIQAVLEEFEEEYRPDEAADVAEFVIAVMERLTVGQTWLLKLMLGGMLAAHEAQEEAEEELAAATEGQDPS